MSTKDNAGMPTNAVPTITVRGTGKVSVAPDRVALHFSVKCREWEYADAIDGLNNQVEELREALEGCGLDRKDLKTSDFDVERATRWDKDEEEHVPNGFEASHSLNIKMPLDQARLNEVLNSIAESMSGASFDIFFETSKEAALRDKVLAAAVADARHKGEVLATAAGLKLGHILHMGHTWTEVSFNSPRYAMDREMCYSAPSPDIEPEDVSSSDTVEMLWSLTGG